MSINLKKVFYDKIKLSKETFYYDKQKRNDYKQKPMTEGKRNFIQGLMQEYEIQSAEDIQDALKDLLSGTIQEMLETEMNVLHIEIA